MKKVVVTVLLALALFLFSGCAIAQNVKTSAEVPTGQVVTLSLPLRDQVKINLDGDPADYFVGREVLNAFPGGMYWIRTDGTQLNLQDAVRRSDPTPIKGTWVITKESGKTALYVYADPKTILDNK